MRHAFTLLADVPVVPDADTARRWAQDELANPTYHQGASLLDRFLEWLRGLFSGLDPSKVNLSPAVAGLVLGVALLVVALVAFWIVGPVRRRRRARAEAAVFAGDDARTAAQIRASSQDAAAREDWTLAVLERFRAVVRSLEERALLDERAGRTAHEVAQDAGDSLPTLAQALLSASAAFDEVCYGHAAADAARFRSLCELDDAVLAATPRRRPATDSSDADADASDLGARDLDAPPTFAQVTR